MLQTAIFEALSIPSGSDLATIEKSLLEKLQEKFEFEGPVEDDEFERRKEDIRRIYTAFFEYADNRIKLFSAKPKTASEPQEAIDLREQAFEMLADIQNSLIEFTLCLTLANRYIAYVEDELEKEDKLIKSKSVKKIEWTSDIDVSIKRMKKRKRTLDKQNERLAKGREHLEAAQRYYEDLDYSLADIATGEDREKLFRAYNSALRISKFPKAEKALREIVNYKKKFSFKNAPESVRRRANNSGQKFIQEIMEHRNDIINEEGKLFISPNEIRNAINANIEEIKYIRKYIAKYHYPYMKGKHGSLSRMRDKLLAIGTFDRLIRLYIDLIKGLSETMYDFPSIREYESTTIERAQYLIGDRFPEIPKITQDTESIMEVFRRDYDMYHNEFKPEDFTGDFDDLPDDLMM
jgi:hypothetical protein